MSEPKTLDELFTLYRATDKEKPKPEDIEALREYFAQLPEQAARLGDLALQAELQVRENAFKTTKAGEVATDQHMYNMRQALGFADASPIERALIQHVVLCWLRLYLTELRYESRMKSSVTPAQGLYWEKLLSSNQRRYLRAIETLTRICKLNVNLQINVAQQQIITGDNVIQA